MSNQPLVTPTPVDTFKLEHPVVMAPLTRMRSSVGNVPIELMAEYLAQRATQGGLSVPEATSV